MKKEHILYIRVIKKTRKELFLMEKPNSKSHEDFFTKFVKFTIWSCVLVTVLLAVLWFFLIR